MATEKRRIDPEKVDMTNMGAFFIQKGSYIDASRLEMICEYGSVNNLIKYGFGLTTTEIEELRDELLD